MREALTVMLELQKEGLLRQFAVGGAIAASFYLEAIATEDLDIFAFITPSASGLLLLTPLYDRIKALGGTVRNEHIVIGTWPVQILPAFNPLIEEAVLNAPLQSYETLQVAVISALHLAAIALQLGRAKDLARITALLDSGAVDQMQLSLMAGSHGLTERWQTYVRRHT